MRKSKPLPYVKRVFTKGREYLYFDTGNGKFSRLPDRSAPNFGGVYGAMLSHRSRRAQTAIELPLSKLLTRYEQSPKFRRLAVNSQASYSTYLWQLCDKLGDPPAAGIERRDIVAVLDTMADRPGAANLMLKVTSAMFAWARRHTEVVIDPCRDIDLHDIGSHKAWPEPLLEEALAADDAKVRLAVSLLYYTAQRVGDVVRMAWGDISVPDENGRRFIHVIQEKTDAELYVPLHGALAGLLDTLPRKRTYSLVEARAERILGRSYTTDTVRAWLQAFASARGLHVVPHGLRKNAVIALLEAECSVAETAAISGQSLAMVEYYAKQRNQRRLGSAAILKLEKRR